MKATHTDYMHPKHLRVVTGQKHLAYNFVQGYFEADVVCMAPSHSQYNRLNKSDLPSFIKG